MWQIWCQYISHNQLARDVLSQATQMGEEGAGGQGWQKHHGSQHSSASQPWWEKAPNLPGAQRLPGYSRLTDFSTKQPPGPGKLSQKRLSLVEDYKRKQEASLEAALCSLQAKLRAEFISPWWRASTLWCWEMKGHTGLVSSRCQTLWPLLTSSCCLSFQSTIQQIGQRKEKSTIKHPFPHYMTSK